MIVVTPATFAASAAFTHDAIVAATAHANLTSSDAIGAAFPALTTTIAATTTTFTCDIIAVIIPTTDASVFASTACITAIAVVVATDDKYCFYYFVREDVKLAQLSEHGSVHPEFVTLFPAKPQNPENSNLHRFELHRPSSKGT